MTSGSRPLSGVPGGGPGARLDDPAAPAGPAGAPVREGPVPGPVPGRLFSGRLGAFLKRYYEGYSGIVRVVLVRLLWRPGVGTCPNLPQRRSGPGLAAKESAEYQRFFSHAPARSGSLWQIWTTRRRGPAGGGGLSVSARFMMSASAWAPARRAIVDRVGAPFDRAGPEGAPPGPRAGAPIRENVT